MTSSIAAFITPHGFGHATRAAAVMAAARELDPAARFEIFTRAPRWLFDQTLGGGFGYHETDTDVGLAQSSSLREDLDETLRRLEAFLPFAPARVEELARQVLALGCRLVACDIAPLGIAVARAAGLPSVLIENFTWDWIYEGYARQEPRLQPFVDYLRAQAAAADYRAQTEPVCAPAPEADLVAAPVCRPARAPRAEVRRRLGVPEETKLVMITMGGIREPYRFLPRLAEFAPARFVIPGDESLEEEAPPNALILPFESGFYHPDVVAACDAVVAKIGYSTLAEVYHAGVPFGYVPRPQFRESVALAGFIRQRMPGVEIAAGDFESGAWLAQLPALLALERVRRDEPNGAVQVAEFLLSRNAG